MGFVGGEYVPGVHGENFGVVPPSCQPELQSSGGGEPSGAAGTGGSTVARPAVALTATPNALPLASWRMTAELYSAESQALDRGGEPSERVFPSQWTTVPYVPKNQQSSHASQAPVVIPPGFFTCCVGSTGLGTVMRSTVAD